MGKINIKKEAKNALLILVGVFSAGFGLESFLIPNNFIDGGVTGISLLVHTQYPVGLSILIVVLNFPFFILGYTQIGKAFALRSAVAVAALAIVIATVPFAPVTHDKLLTAFFGGFFVGGGMGLAMRAQCVIDGTDILALYINRRSSLSIGNIILMLNVVIFSVAAFLLNTETAMYAILTYLAASFTLDYIVNGIERYIGVTIITRKVDEVKAFILNEMKRGVTIYQGKGGFNEGKEMDIIYTVVTKLEMGKLQTALDEIDKNAFVVQTQIAETKGGMVKEHVLH